MRVALFVPCYIDQLYPQVAIATLELLESLGCNVAVPLDQTCCGQPMANAGFESASVQSMQVFIENFDLYDYIVAPSGSCVLHVRDHVKAPEQSAPFQDRVFELCQFLVDILQIKELPGSFNQKVGLHQSCHGLRGLRLGTASELRNTVYSKPAQLLSLKKGVELMPLKRDDECCGFGGTFAVTEEAISVKMGRDRIEDHLEHEVEVLTSTDMSCLMHLEGLIKKEEIPIKVMHIAEVLNG